MVTGVLRAALNGGERKEHDYYPTPREVTEALAPNLTGWPRHVWEPACGDGGIALPLDAAGFRVIGTDLIDRGYGRGGVDFPTTAQSPCEAIITNPPFGNLVTPFIRHAVITLRVPYVAILVNVNLWHAGNRFDLWHERLPAVEYACCWKPDFTGGGRPYFNVIWSVWIPEPAAFTRKELLRKPRPIEW